MRRCCGRSSMDSKLWSIPCQGSRGRPALLDPKAHPAIQADRPGHRDRKAMMARPAHKVFKVRREMMAHPEPKALKGRRAQPEPTAHRDRRGHKVRRVILEVRQAPKGRKARRAVTAHPARKGRPAKSRLPP